jgi:chaperone required for assembly of F1-ATPase
MKRTRITVARIRLVAAAICAGTPEDIWSAACLDELWQEELWGADHWAQKNRSDREGEFMAAARLLDLLALG